VRHDQSAPPPAGHAANGAAAPPALILLCPDCCALLVNAIDDDEWHRRIDDPDAVAVRPTTRIANPPRVPLLLTEAPESAAAPPTPPRPHRI